MSGPDSIEHACEAVRRGEIVGLPTDTVYGLGIDPRNPAAYELLYAAKRRQPDKAIPILVADAAQAAEIVEVSALGRRLMDRHWPGGLTIVQRRRRDVPVHIGDPVTATVAVRAPADGTTHALLAECGPLAVTSANLSGERASLDADEAQRALGSTVAVYLRGEGAPAGVASTVVDATGDEPLVLRLGSVDIGAS
jgi:L-threonylcarbamoyladenylate synthase